MSGKVLIAEDEPSIVTSLEFLMQRSGYEVRVARDGDEAMRLVGSSRIWRGLPSRATSTIIDRLSPVTMKPSASARSPR